RGCCIVCGINISGFVSYETTYIYSTDDAATPVCQMKLSISWNNPPKYLEENFVNVVTKQKLNFYSADGNQWIRFKCTKEL
ncbi:MAG: hypothetical protein J7L46_00935, partial [Bacteroidales bacterium]|nr:hypothetical protein [Bacteroidales bacterium]